MSRKTMIVINYLLNNNEENQGNIFTQRNTSRRSIFLYQGMRTVRKKLEGRLPTEVFNVVFVFEPCDCNYIFKDKVTKYIERSQSYLGGSCLLRTLRFFFQEIESVQQSWLGAERNPL